MAARGFPYTDLKDFLAALERAGELRRVDRPVDPTLEISEIVTRTVRAGGPALLFERPTRGEMPLAINLFGTEKRMAMALGVDSLDEIGDRIGALIKPELPVGWSGIREGLGKVMQLKSVPPSKVKTAPCQEVVYPGDDVDLGRLPGLQVWPDDGGIFHNYGLTHTKHPETGKRNLGLYRLQQHSRNTLGMHWQIHKDSTAHHAVAERLGERLPVAIAIGCDPVVSYAASAPLPGDIDEYLFAGFLRGERVEMVDCLTVPLQVPAHAQIVLEGYLEPGERLPEGPFGDHTGFYTPVEPFPVLHIETMTMQRNPVYHSIVTSKPPQEDHGLGKATERIFQPLLKLHDPGHRRLRPAGRRGVPQLRDRVDPQALPEARPEGDERDLGRAPDVADQADRDRRRGLRRARLPRGRLPGLRQRRLRPRPAAHRGPGRPPRPRLLPAVLGRQGGRRRHPQAPRPRATPGAGRRR